MNVMIVVTLAHVRTGLLGVRVIQNTLFAKSKEGQVSTSKHKKIYRFLDDLVVPLALSGAGSGDLPNLIMQNGFGVVLRDMNR